MKLFGLADCNNFYASCERVFHPELNGRPVVVLSNNDGCIIARSNESKAMGLKMGAPFYQVKELLERENVAVFSSNYNLYGDMSRRVMSILSRYTPHLDIYSIDESFMDLSDMGDAAYTKRYGEEIARVVRRSTGIPISLGIAPTRTLAKMASKFAKKYKGYKGCCLIDTDEKRLKALSLFEVGDIWGVGRQHLKVLDYNGIHTALDLASKSEGWVRSKFNVNMVRTWKELNGVPCIEVAELPHKQSICTSRSFAGEGITDHAVLEEAVANFAAQCAEKLRRQHTCCAQITTFAYTSRFRTDIPGDVIHLSTTLPVSTNNTREIIGTALALLRKGLTTQRYAYKKAGVILWGITSDEAIQGDLFDTVDRPRQAALTQAIDQINRRLGHNRVRLAAQGVDVRFGLKHEYISHQYTTNIDDLMTLKV